MPTKEPTGKTDETAVTDETDEIVLLTLGRPPSCGQTRVVSIDGPAGSGKTTLAAAVAGALGGQGIGSATLHMDDFYEGWDGLQADLGPRLVNQILAPLASGRPGRWQRYDWHARSFGDWSDLPVPDVLVLEGCGSGARAYDPYRSVLVWIEADRETRISRGVERDGEEVLPLWLAWMQREEAHFQLNDTRAHADLALRS